jgi:glycosyltransferase involved in cell wall biosynthesis
MRIVHFIHRIDPNDGGTPAVVVRLAAAQATAGHIVRLAAYAPTCTETELNNCYGGIESFAIVEKCYFKNGGLIERLCAVSASKSMRDRLGQPDFVHVHGLWRPLLLRAAQYCSSVNVPYAVTPHGMATRWAMSQKQGRKHAALALGWRRALQHASFLHYVNETERVESVPVRATAPVVVIPNGVSLKELNADQPANAEFVAQLPQRYVLFLARLNYYKGLDLLIPAFARIAPTYPDVNLVIAGTDFGYESSLRQLIATSGLSPRIQLLGGVYGNDKLHLLRHALCLCHPTRHEGFSVTLLEAMATSLPIITTSQANFPEIATVGAGIISMPNPNSIADALSRLLKNDALRAQMGAEGLRVVIDRYEWSIIAASLTCAYLSAARTLEPREKSSQIP